MTDLTWTRKTLADILGEDRAIPDEAALQALPFGQEDLDELLRDERQAALSAFRETAQASRNAREPESGAVASARDTRPEYNAKDIAAGLGAARAALEAVPAGKRSERAEALLADCACPVPQLREA